MHHEMATALLAPSACRLLVDAQQPLDTLPEILRRPLTANSSDVLKALAQYRTNRPVDGTIDVMLRPYDSHNYQAVVTPIEAVKIEP